ncbi:hypothetical protein [uncultured Bacteroides sp.]|uniref:hypothetical protein n=1 Tax=uncultured Bacteroides sp. TaxID=162156 RepID=UPI00262286BE|nr:hypothetical protein [uncultured Bacteroides sp.]
MNKDDKQRESLSIQAEASTLLASEMSEIKGGTMSSGCGLSSDEPKPIIKGDEISSVMGCSSCNKTHSCQTHT